MSFEKVERSDRTLYGSRKLVLCGFPPEAQSKFKALLQMIGIRNLPLVWVTSDTMNSTIAELLQQENDTGEGLKSDMDRALIVSGIAENELHQLMNGCRDAGMQKALWAAVTPTSENWSVSKLLAELKAEQKAMADGNPRQRGR